jgi:ribosomal protein S18 acetylase RimI-like enzyme
VRGLKLRDAQAGDRQAVFDFCRDTWPGYGDYIPRVWRDWLRDRSGRVIVAELDGRPVGLAKVTEFSKGEIWLEGLRVGREYRHRGIARALNLEVLQTVRRLQPRVVRLCTGADNLAARRMAEKGGFRIAARLRYYWQKSRKARVRGEIACKGDIDSLSEFILNSRYLRLTSGLIAEGWVFREFNRRLLTRYVNEQRVVVIRKPAGIAGAAIFPYEENDRSLALGFVDGDEGSIGILARNCMYLARMQGLTYCSVAVPSRRFAGSVEKAGFRRKDSTGQVVYELGGKVLESPALRQAP